MTTFLVTNRAQLFDALADLVKMFFHWHCLRTLEKLWF
jgi:beta-xylosidase